MKKKAKKTNKILGIIMSTLGTVGIKKSNTKVKRRAKKLAKTAAKFKK
jgi:hypothetical protein